MKQAPSDGMCFRRNQITSGRGAVPIFRRANTSPAAKKTTINTLAILQGVPEDATAQLATQVQGVW